MSAIGSYHIQITCLKGASVVFPHEKVFRILKNSRTLTYILGLMYDEIYYTGRSVWNVRFINHQVSHIDSASGIIGIISITKQKSFKALSICYTGPSELRLNTKNYEEQNLLEQTEKFTQFLNLLFLNKERETGKKAGLGDPLFVSDIYKSFHRQLLLFIQRYKDENPNALKHLSREFGRMTSRVLDSCYENYHKMLLEILRVLKKEKSVSTAESAERKKFLNAFTYWLFTSVNLDKEREECLVNKCSFLSTQNPIDLSHLTNIIYTLYSNVSLTGVIGRPFSDRHKEGCITSNLGKLVFGIHSTILLQLPQFCYHSMLENAGLEIPILEILPEAKTFIGELKKKRERLLYINLMKDKELVLQCQETRFTDHIISNVKSKAIKIVCLDRYSDTATQKNEVLGKWTLFLHSMILKCSQMFTGLTGFDGSILNKIHEHYFDSKPELSQEEKRDFYEILLVEALSDHLEKNRYDFLTISCAFTTEESGSLSALLFLHQTVKQRKPLNDEFYKKIFTMLCVNSLLIKNCPPYIYFIDLFHSCASRIIKKGVLPRGS